MMITMMMTIIMRIVIIMIVQSTCPLMMIGFSWREFQFLGELAANNMTITQQRWRKTPSHRFVIICPEPRGILPEHTILETPGAPSSVSADDQESEAVIPGTARNGQERPGTGLGEVGGFNKRFFFHQHSMVKSITVLLLV